MSTDKIYQSVSNIVTRLNKVRPIRTHLDIGSGNGALIRKLRKDFRFRTSCCDYTDSLMAISDQKVDIVNLNETPLLPYDDCAFDLITATELIEHIENYRNLLREIYRVLEPGGVCILSTPNVLSLKSRLRYFHFGFPELFGPLPMIERDLHTTAGHITLIPYFYLHHALLESKFSRIRIHIDKYQRSGILRAFLFWLPIKLMEQISFYKEKNKYKTIDEMNLPVVRQTNSLRILLGRTIIVEALKEAGDCPA